MVAAGDEHFLPEHTIRAVSHGPGTGPQVAQRRALAGFGEGHGATETPLQHGCEKALAQFSAGKTLDQVGGTNTEEGVGDRGDVGGIEIGHAGAQQHFGQLQAAVGVIMVCRQKTRLGKGIPRRLGFRDQRDVFAIEGRLVGIALVVMRGKIVGGKLARGIESGIEHGTVMLGVTRTLQQRLRVEHFVELEAQFAFIEQ
ncbi:hypothetical protein D3C85_892890 [compost metagenome]